MTTLARSAHQALEAVHAMIYFVPEAKQRFAALGLDSFGLAYFGGRAAPMGAVGAGVVTATFYNFSPTTVADSIPKAWSIASPADIVSARFDAADAALRRLLGAELAESPDVAEAAELAARACEGCAPEARPLYAGHADLEWPETPLLRLWHATSLLREYRGDGHLLALQRAGLSGVGAVVLQSTSGTGLAEGFAQKSRGWSDDEWESTKDALRARGLVDPDRVITEAGANLREEIEVETDSLASGPYTHLGKDSADRLLQIGSQLSRALLKAGAFPRENFAGA